MPTYKKRNESSVVTSVMKYLQTLENSGKIAFYNRQQAGKLPFQRNGKWQCVRLGREGVADIWIIPNNSCSVPIIWVECKLDNCVLSVEQMRFQRIVEMCLHKYWIIHDCNELERKFKEIGVL